MKFKQYIYIAATLLLGGCSLVETANGFMSTENFYKTEDDAIAACLCRNTFLQEFFS